MRYVVEEGDWMPFANEKSSLIKDTKENYIICECTYEEDVVLICKLLNEHKE